MERKKERKEEKNSFRGGEKKSNLSKNILP